MDWRSVSLLVGAFGAAASLSAGIWKTVAERCTPRMAGVELPPAANDGTKTTFTTRPQIGDEMGDGTIFAGISPDTLQPMYATPLDASGQYDSREAEEFAAYLNRCGYAGHKDWRLPTAPELSLMFSNLAAIGGFHSSSYRSSTRFENGYAVKQSFSTGERYSFAAGPESTSLRCVRG
jgi:hypothetical protein